MKKNRINKKLLLSLSVVLGTLLFGCVSCSKDDAEIASGINPGNDPNFKIVANTDAGTTQWNRKVVVFGVDVYAAPKSDDAKLLHAANVLAQYLDNDEDGKVDNQAVADKLVENKAFLIMWKTQDDIPAGPPSGRVGQDLGSDETQPNFVTGGRTGTFDGALEEVLHLVTSGGYAKAYPNVFAENEDSEIAKVMDIARGGHFTSIPNPYPNGAWYTYNDETCQYNCQIAEYHYWALTSMLGAQENRLDEIDDEWRLNTREKVQQTDTGVYALLTDPQYKFPTVLPDGTYKR